MAKNIVICADGTGNSANKGRGTNVFKLYEAVDENRQHVHPELPEQVAIYHDGVGTESLKWLRIATGATGWGLSRNVKQLYGELARVYDPGDHIFLFGFSRGAFTVRTLGGLIAACGVLDLSRYPTNAAFTKGVNDAYAEYRRKYQTVIQTLLHGKITLDRADLRRRFSVPLDAMEPGRCLIDFVGVWDTVDAVGLPLHTADAVNRVFYAFKFPDGMLSDEVAYGCHALALDEQRQSFAPVLWDEAKASDRARIEQVWFAGVHSNVGGGYPRQGMSLVALDWMMSRAEARGLRFIPEARQAYRDAADVNDKQYNSRGGFGLFYRWKPRDVKRLCGDNSIVAKVHRTVYERIARNTEGYAPGTVPPDAVVISTSAPAAITEAISGMVKAGHHGDESLVERQRPWLTGGKAAYWLLITSVVVVVVLMAMTFVEDAATGSPDWKVTLLSIAGSILSSHWIDIAVRTVWRHPWVISIAALALALVLIVDEHLDGTYSAFWHDLRVDLRKVLEERL